MKTNLFSISKIFTERILRIPDYQRGYSWTEKHLKDFWNDLVQLEENKNHYTGVLTLEDVPKESLNGWPEDHWIIFSKSYSPYYVVDGQQRLTTAIILIQAILESIGENKKLNYTDKEDIRKKFIYETKDEGISRSYIFGYEKDNPSYEYLKTNIFMEPSDESCPIQETIYTHNLDAAKQYFLNNIREIQFEDIEIIFKKLTQNFLFNIYAISEDIDVFVAFETMNNRGKPLSHLELLKNRLIYLSTKFEEEDWEKNKLRYAVNEAWKSIYHYLGKNKDNPLDDDEFLFNHFILYFNDPDEDTDDEGNINFPLAIRRSFFRREYQDFLLESKFTTKSIRSVSDPLRISDIYDYVKSLKASGEVWFHILNPSDSKFSKEEKYWLDKLNRLDVEPFAPLLMVFFQKEKNKDLRIHLLKSLERQAFIRTLIRYPFRIDNSDEMTSYAIDLRRGKLSSSKLIKSVDSSFDETLSKSQIIKDIIEETRGNGFYSWRGLRYFMYEYELSLKENSKSNRTKLDWDLLNEERDDFYTIEHIYPQRPRRDYWTSKFSKYNAKERSALRHSLGNLLPLSKPKNSSFQNKSFIEKIGNNTNTIGYKYGSFSEIEVTQYPDWTPKEILERGLKLIDFMELRWNIKFGDVSSKLKFLNLEFVAKKENVNLKMKKAKL